MNPSAALVARMGQVPRMRFVQLAAWVGALALAGCSKARAPVETSSTLAPAVSAHASAEHVKAVGQLGPGRGTLVLSLQAPEHGKLTRGTPLSVEARGEHLSFPRKIRTTLEADTLPLRIPIDVADGATGPAFLRVSYVWCGAGDDTTCHPERTELEVDLDTSGDSAGGEAHVVHRPGS